MRRGTELIKMIPTNLEFLITNLMCKVASELGITVDSEKSQEVQYQSVSDHLSCDKQNNSSPRCRLPLDGVVLNALHSVNKEFVNKGTLRTFKASDDEKFQISSDHFNQGFSLSPLSLLNSDWLRAKIENSDSSSETSS
jgi:hypothetical protein